MRRPALPGAADAVAGEEAVGEGGGGDEGVDRSAERAGGVAQEAAVDELDVGAAAEIDAAAEGVGLVVADVAVVAERIGIALAALVAVVSQVAVVAWID